MSDTGLSLVTVGDGRVPLILVFGLILMGLLVYFLLP